MDKDKLISQAEKFVQEGKLDKAIKEYEKVVAGDSHDTRTKLKLADLFSRQKQTPKAVAVYREVGEQYMQDNFSLKAIAVYKTILKMSPTLIDINEKLGDLYRQIGLTADAINQYYIVAGSYDNKGLTRESMEIRQKIVELDPSNTTGRIRLAELMQAEGKTDDSYREYERVAEFMKNKKDRDGLAEVYEKMLHYRPENKKMLDELCKIYFAKRDFKKVLKKIESSPVALKDDLEIALLWAEALLEDRQIDMARKKFRVVFSNAVEAKKTELVAMIKSRLLQEFSDDEDYLREIEDISRQSPQPPPTVAPHHRQDFEKTEMVDLDSFDFTPKK